MSDLDKILNGTYNKKKKTDLDAILSGTYEMPKEPPKMEYNLPPRYNSTWDRTKSSLQNTGYLLGKGALKSIEGTMDWANKMSDKVDYGWRKALFGQDYAEQQRNQTRDFIKTDYTQKVGNKTGISNKIIENEGKGSIIKRNNLGGQLAEAVGGQLPTLVASGLAGVGKANALLESTKGLSKGAKFGATALINALPNAMLASRSYGGALEEALNEGATDEEAERYAIGSTAVEIASEWVTGGIPGTNGKGGLDYFADKGIDKISNALVKDLTKFGYKIVGEGAEEGISEIISPFLKNATYSEGNKIDWKSVINSAIIGGLSAGIIDAPTNIQQLKFDINNSINNGSNQLNTEDIRLPKPNEVPKVETVENIVDKPSIQETTVEELATDKPLKFQYETSENSKINELNESMSKYFNNSEKTKQLSDTISKVIEDKNYKVVFDDGIVNKVGKSVNAKVINKDGNVEIRINPNNPRAVEFLMVHEITHAIETESMKNLVMDYASKNEGFNEALESLKQTYGTNDVSDEVLADISGQLFGNQEFINNLSMEKPNIFKRLYNKIIEIANKITGNSNEALFIRDLKQKWEAAYRNVNNNVAKMEKNSISQEFDSNGNQLSKIQTIFFDQSRIRNNKGELLEVYHGTPNKGFNKYDKSKLGSTTNAQDTATGFHFTDNYELAKIFKNFITEDIGKRAKQEVFDKYHIQSDELIPINLKEQILNEIDAKEIELAEQSGEVKKQFLNITNPFEIFGEYGASSQKIADDLVYAITGEKEISDYTDEYDSNMDFLIAVRQNFDNELAQVKDMLSEPESMKRLKELGYDGLVLDITETDKASLIEKGVLPKGKEFIAFEPNQIKNVDNLDPSTDEDIRYSQKDKSWQEHLEKNYKATGTRTFTKDIINEVEETITKPKGNLTLEETKELEVLNTMDDAFGLEPQEEKRKNDLIKKRDNFIKYPELKEKITFDDIKKQYSKYKDLSGFNEKLLNTAKSFVPGYGKTGRRTKTEWLQVANAIGSNFKGNSEALEKYAIQSWFKSKPNMKENLNRQGQSYVKFSIDEWVNEVYKGAGVGEIIKKVNLPTKEIKKVQETPTETTKILPTTNKTLNPIEISNLTKEDASSTPKLPTIKVKTGEGKSKFAKNIETKTNMLTKESKQNILASDEVTTYEKTTNKADMEKAKAKLDNGGKNEVINWLAKDTKKATSTDVAEGWILLKRYQDEAIKAKDAATKDEMNRAMVQVAKKMRAMGTSAGQTVQAFNIMNRLTPEGMVYYAQSGLDEAFDLMKKNKTKEWIDENSQKFVLTPEETQFIINNVEEASKLPENSYEKKVKLAEIQKVMTDKLPPKKGAGIKAWMRISMLFNPKTQVRNVLGNAVILPVNVVGDKFSSMVDKQIAKITGVRTKGSSLKGYGHEWVKGVDQSISEGKKGISTRDIEGNKFEIGEGKSFNDNTKVGKALNIVDRTLSTMLDAGDRGFYNATFETSLRNQMVLNHTTEVTPEMIAIATNEALSRTWQDSNDYTRFVLNVRSMMNKGKPYGIGDVLIPFAKTPANLTKAIVDYSPVGLVSSIKKGINLKRSLNNGQFTPQLQHEFVDSLGKATAGTMLYVLGTALAQAGITSGDNDKDKDVSNFMRNVLGKNSYSITIGGKSYSYSWAQPLAAPLSITANIVNKKKEDANFIEKTLSSLNIAGDILLEQSFMDSINTVLNNRDGFFTGLEEAILDLPARAIPTLFKQIADIVDPQQRTSFEYDKPLKTLLNKIKSKLPIASKELTTSYDTLGRPIMKYGGKNNLFNVFLNPANIATENISKSGEEIYRLYKETGDKTIMPRVAPYYINQKGEKINLSTKEKSEFQKISGGIIESEVDKLMQNKIYKNATDEEKAEYVKEIVDYSYNLAREEIVKIPMSQSYKKINQYVRDGGSPSDYYTHKEEINYAYENPTRYATIRQITDYDKYTSYKKELDTIRDNFQDKRSATIKYINSLNLSIPKKAMLIKTYYKSFKNYDKQIIKYINSQDISVEEKTAILKDLGFTVRNGRVY